MVMIHFTYFIPSKLKAFTSFFRIRNHISWILPLGGSNGWNTNSIYKQKKTSKIYIFSVIVGFISEKAMATHSNTPAWKIPWMEEPGRLQSMGSLRVRHDWETSLSLSHLNQLEEEEQAKPKVIRRKEKEESRNKLHNRKQFQRSMKPNAGSWKR